MNNNGYRIVVDAGHESFKFPKNMWCNELGFMKNVFIEVLFSSKKSLIYCILLTYFKYRVII